jgi:quercetin dioxygenase-like cupin family protein
VSETPNVSDNPNVTDRTPAGPQRLLDLGDQVLDEARVHSNGRSALTLTPGEGGPLKQTLLGIKAGEELSEHPAPGPASIQILAGVATLSVEGDEQRLEAGTWAPIPTTMHGLRAEEDLVALLTVATSR